VSDGVLVLRKAAGLAIDQRCPRGEAGRLATGTRQAIGNNPFRDLTKIPNAGAGTARAVLAQRSPSFPDRARVALAAEGRQVIPCTRSGSATETCTTRRESDGSISTVFTIDFDRCALPQNDGHFVVESGIARQTVPHFSDCSALPFAIGHQLLEERESLVFEDRDSAFTLLSRATHDNAALITYTESCTDRQRNNLAGRRVHAVNGLVEIVSFVDHGEVRATEIFDDVALTTDLSPAPACAATETFDGGSIRRVDGRLDETFTTAFGGDAGDLSYALDEGALEIAGGLTSVCGGAETIFAYRTVEPSFFDPAEPDGCPRGGSIEISSDGAVIGQALFTSAGGVRLVAVDGQSTLFANCNDAGLVLRCE
jgi:hypothetical protein